MVENEIVPALDSVGKAYENKTLFLPQLLMSADAAKAAFGAVKNKMSGDGSAVQKATIVMATVKGDIHDIGKNIVCCILENYGYKVIDLGHDVSPEVIVQAAMDQDAMMVGLSALMTTTVPGMKETVKLLKEQAPSIRVMVGGAVLTEEYAKQMNADYYASDAMAAVRYAESLCNKE